jgi:type VI secretion system protein ImpL
MNMMAWIRIAAILVGVLALAILIWFAGPLVAIGEVRPFDEVWPRLGLIVLVLAIAGIAIGLDIHKRRKASAALEQAITTTDEPEGDARVLQETMKDALATLRTAKGKKGDYLYDLPWYVIIGPPGAGKTTALVNSGLKFPLARGGTPEAIAGVGGTRYCDWWFTEDAVLIDTAGRYTTQDSDPKGDRKSWLAFLDLLKKNRPKQPINGVLVAISVEDLLTAGAEEVDAHAAAVRKRLAELHEHLKIDFPVYALLTKSDLVAGFRESFENLTEAERQMVWGHTFQTSDRTRNMIGEVPSEYDALVSRLNEQLTDRLQDEPTPAARVVLFGFPSQMAALKRPVVEFLNRVFEPTRYHANATLRGFYFTSGTQQGTPIDKLIGTLAKNFGAEEVPNIAYSGRGKSFFLTDLLRKVVIGEAGWVSNNRAAVRHATVAKVAAFACLGALTTLAVALWWISFGRNRELIASTENSVTEYRTIAGPLLRETTVSDRSFGKVLPLLHKLRHMPTGYASRNESEPIANTFGLSQRDRLQSAAETAYEVALERMFRSRLIYRLEEQLESNINNPGFVYEALKVYLMVGGQAPVDRDFVVAWMRSDWADNLFPGAANVKGREALEEHLLAMLDLNVGSEPSFQLNQALIEDCQRTLARMSVAERAYELLKSQARISQRDWVVAFRGGPDASLVLEGASGEDLESIRVPFFYTYDGFHTAFMDRLESISERVEKERWVLGSAGQQSAVASQYSALYQDLLRLYTRDFTAAWQQALKKLKLRPLTADKPRYVALSAASAATSPIRQVIESIRDETQLTRERPQAAPTAADQAKAAAQGAATQAAGRIAQSVAARARLSVPTGLDAPSQGLIGTASGEAPGANIEALFKGFHVLLEGDGGRRPIDALLSSLSEINQNLAIAATNPQQAASANAALVQHVATLRATASRFPAPFDQMIRTAANDFEGDASGATVATLQQSLADQVSRVCQQVVTNRYPFIKGSDREVPLADFARLFAPGGIMDKFFKQQLEPYVDQSRLPWTWRVDSRVARGLSTVTLRQFQQASEIRDAFFATGGNMPSFTMAVTPLTLSGDAATARFEINGTAVASQQGVNAPTNVNWPGGGVARSAITIGGGGGGGFFGGGFFSQPTVFQRDGTWSFFRLLDAGSVLKKGDGIVASFVVGGREVSYEFNVGSLMNPLVLPALREFRCPTGI